MALLNYLDSGFFTEHQLLAASGISAAGLASNHEKMHAGLDAHLRKEWDHFLDGTYGLCTRSGLPGDIAAKELATIVIDQLCEGEATHNPAQGAQLRLAVSVLDQACAAFAPHERARCSRNRLVEMARKHGCYL